VPVADRLRPLPKSYRHLSRTLLSAARESPPQTPKLGSNSSKSCFVAHSEVTLRAARDDCHESHNVRVRSSRQSPTCWATVERSAPLRLRLTPIGEVEDERNCKAHLISVLGGDSEVGASWAAVIEQSLFTVEAPGIEPLTATLGENAQCFCGTITIAGRRPIRHLVAISAELAKTRPGADPQGRRTILCDNDPTFVQYRIAQRFGLPVAPDWADWFNEELNRRGAIKPLIGLGCSPVLVSATKKLFLKWIRRALRQKRIEVPDCNGPVRWSLAHSVFRVGKDDLGEESRQETSKESSAIPAEVEDKQPCESLVKCGVLGEAVNNTRKELATN